MHHRQRESHRDRSIDGIATLLQNFDSRIGGVVMHRDHHRMPRPHRLFALIVNSDVRRRLRRRRERESSNKET